MNSLTEILTAIRAGDPRAPAALESLVHREIRRLAAEQLRRRSSQKSLDVTALVQEAYRRMIVARMPNKHPASTSARGTVACRRHFFHAAADAIRRIRVLHARRKAKECADMGKAARDEGGSRVIDVVAFDSALRKLAACDLHKAELVKLRCFAGLVNDEAAELLGLTPLAAKRAWDYSLAWLQREIANRRA